MFKDAAQNKSLSEKQELAKHLIKYEDVFSKNEHDLGLLTSQNTQLTPMEQNLFDNDTDAHHRHRVEEKAVIEKLKAQGVIRESSSPWLHPFYWYVKKMVVFDPW